MDKLFNLDFLKLFGSLLFTIVANTGIAVGIAEYAHAFNKEVLINGLKKNGIVVASIVCAYLACEMNPLHVANVNGHDVTLLTGMTLIFEGASIYYGAKFLSHLAKCFGIGGKIEIKDEEGDSEYTFSDDEYIDESDEVYPAPIDHSYEEAKENGFTEVE